MIKQSLHILISLVLAAMLGSCAQELNPTGGPRDEIPPEVVKSDPVNETLNVNSDKVKFVFDEPIQKPDAKKDIFISPFVRRPRVILSDNGKRLTVELGEELRPQTTYVITLNGIKDLHERNQIEEPYTLAFSTGDQLDSLAFEGDIVNPEGKGVKDMLVLLFDADSVIGNDIRNKRPAYLSRSDEQGHFSFKFLREAPYRVFGVMDEDQSNTWNLPNEMVAISADSVLNLTPGDSTSLDTVRLVAFEVDETAPRLRRYFWTNETTLAVQLSEAIRLSAVNLFVTDTTRQDTLPITVSQLVPGAEPELWVHAPGGRRWLDLHLIGFQDSLGNRQDSVLRVSPERDRLWETPLKVKPALKLQYPAIEFLSQKYVSEADRGLFSLTDTSSVDSLRKVFPLEWLPEGMTQRIRPLSDSAIGKPLVLRIAGEFFYGTEDSTAVDTVFTYPVTWLKPDAYGTLTGRVIPDSTYDGPVIIRLKTGKNVVRTFSDTTFSFNYLEAGEYSFSMIYDEDGNGMLTTGSLSEQRLPERRKSIPGTITIRANWDFEDHVVDLNASPAPAPKEVEPGSEEDPDNSPPGSRPGRP